jgi:hypothetical protein
VADSREAVLLDEARRAISRQEATLDTLHVKAVAVLSSSAIVAGLMGGSLPTQHLHWSAVSVFTVLALGVFAATGVLTVLILRPVGVLFSGGIKPLLAYLDDEKLVDGDDEKKLRAATRRYERQIATDLDKYRLNNVTTIGTKTDFFGWACKLLGSQVVLWAVARLIV